MLAATPTLPACRGEVRPPVAVACLRNLGERGRVAALPADRFLRVCRTNTCSGCTAHDRNTECRGDTVIVPEILVPPNLVDVVSIEATGCRSTSSVWLGSLLYHESIHTVQGTRNRGCRGDDGVEVEAYEQELRLDLLLNAQLGTIVGRTDPGTVCENTLDVAVTLGLLPCVRDFIVDVFGARPDATLPADGGGEDRPVVKIGDK